MKSIRLFIVVPIIIALATTPAAIVKLLFEHILTQERQESQHQNHNKMQITSFNQTTTPRHKAQSFILLLCAILLTFSSSIPLRSNIPFNTTISISDFLPSRFYLNWKKCYHYERYSLLPIKVRLAVHYYF